MTTREHHVLHRTRSKRFAVGIVQPFLSMATGVLMFIAVSALTYPLLAQVEAPIEVTVCEIKHNPEAYNHKLIKITGSVHRGFEVFTLSDDSCTNADSLGTFIWLEFGGAKGSEVMYCCGVSANPVRSAPLIVEGLQ